MDLRDYPIAVLNEIRSLTNLQPDQPVIGARLGASLKAGGLDWSQFGFSKLSEVIDALAKQGYVRAGPSAPHPYAVWLEKAGREAAIAFAGTRQVVPPESAPHIRLRPLRHTVWSAFVSEQLATPRAFHRVTGEVRTGSKIPNQDSNFIEIAPISSTEQREWATVFLTENLLGENVELTASIQHPRWFAEFPRLLAIRDPNLAVAWKRDRSRRVQRIVEDWSRNNQIQEAVVFGSERGQDRGFASGVDTRTSLRDLLLTAVSSLTTDELLGLSLPARRLVEVLRPDLLD